MRYRKFIGVVVAALTLPFVLCSCGDKKSRSGSGSGSSSNQAQGKFSPMVTKDAVFALGVNLDKQQAFKVVDAYLDQACSWLRGEKSAEVKATVAKYKKDLFADAPLQLRDFFDETGLCDTKLRWAVVSWENLRMMDGGPQLYGLSVAIAGNVNLEKLIQTIQKESTRDEVVFTEMSLEGERIWRIEPHIRNFWGWNVRAWKEVGVDLHVTSLDDQLILLTSSRGALAKQIRLYRQGAVKSDALGGFSAKEGELLHLKVDDVGERILNICKRKDVREVTQLLPDGERVVMGLGAFEGGVKVSSDGAVRTSASLKAASEEDADKIRTLAKVGLMKACSQWSKSPYVPKECVKVLEAVKIGGTDGEIKFQNVDPISLLILPMYFGRGVAVKVAGATEAISVEEGSKASGAKEPLNENTIRDIK